MFHSTETPESDANDAAEAKSKAPNTNERRLETEEETHANDQNLKAALSTERKT